LPVKKIFYKHINFLKPKHETSLPAMMPQCNRLEMISSFFEPKPMQDAARREVTRAGTTLDGLGKSGYGRKMKAKIAAETMQACRGIGKERIWA